VLTDVRSFNRALVHVLRQDPDVLVVGEMRDYEAISTALTAAASLALPFTSNFAVFLVAWTLQGFYVVWLPLEIAIIWSRTRGRDGASLLTARAAGILVASLEGGAIAGALAGGQLVDTLPLWIVLLVPALLVVACYFVIAFGVKSPIRFAMFPDTTSCACRAWVSFRSAMLCSSCVSRPVSQARRIPAPG